MDKMPIFRPPTPPQAGFFFFLCLLFVVTFSFAKDPSKHVPVSYTLYFQVLSDLGPTLSKKYVQEVMDTLKISKSKIDKKFTSQNFFDEPVFNRVEWNKFSMDLNSNCLVNHSNTCLKLAKTRNKYLKEYQKVLLKEKELSIQKAAKKK